jgi:AraC-like DNA-binding protein
MLISPRLFSRLCRARDRLGAADSPSVSRLANELHLSPFRFIRAFQALFGITPHQLRIAARLERAKQLLAAPGKSVTHVCMDLGFSSLGTFSSSFTRRIGRSPSAYRKRRAPPAAEPGCLTLLNQLPAGALCNFEEASAGAREA